MAATPSMLAQRVTLNVTERNDGNNHFFKLNESDDFCQTYVLYIYIVQVIALICGLLVVILMVLGLASADWLMAAGWRQGLFMHCIDPGAPMPLPFDITAQPGCYAARPAPYIK